MKKFFCFLVFIGLVVFSQCIFAASNRVNNHDFESGNIGGWSTWAVTDTLSASANRTPGGKFGASPSLNAENGPFELGALIQEFDDFRSGDTVCASVWVKTVGLKGAQGTDVFAILKLEFWSGDKVVSSRESSGITGTNDWYEMKVETVVPENTTKVKILLLLWNKNGTGNIGDVYFDDAYIGNSPRPSYI
ncbi:MAG: hypothetical protein PHO00_07825 [bacterium]|nr:hypothetical protein [bacterium]